MAHLELKVATADVFDVRHFSVHEGLSTPFLVTLTALSRNEDVDLGKIVGQPARFLVRSGYQHVSAPTRLWTGIVAQAEQRQPETKGYSTYYFRIVPRLWLLTERRLCRIYQHQTIPQIVQQVLDQWQIKAISELKETYKQLEYCVQYNETDYDFVCRLLEQAGITFFFIFDEEKVTELKLSDKPHLGPKRAGEAIPFVDNPSEAAEREFLTKVWLSHDVRPGRVTVRDFDFRKKPDFPFYSSGAPAPAPEDFYEHYHYRPGCSLVVPGEPVGESTPEADRKGVARHDQTSLDAGAVRDLAALRRDKRRIAFETNCVDLAPGLIFHMRRHNHQEIKAKSDLLVAEIVLDGTNDGPWSFRAVALFSGRDNPYQPARKTARPRIMGVQSAIVTGPANEEIHTDEFGRVKVQFHRDRDHAHDDQSSCWMRVSQGWAGAGYGTMMIPRVGQEVLVGFFDGDPDQPVIVGRVYNGKNLVPYPLPQHKTRSVWKSHSSPKASGSNEILFEDQAGSEFVYVQAQRDLQRLVKNNETERTGDSRHQYVGGSRHTVVGKIDATLVGEKYHLQMSEKLTPEQMKILEQRKPEPTLLPIKLEMVNDTIFATSGDAKMTIQERDIVLEAKGDIYIRSTGGNVIFEGGSFIKINC